MTVEHSLGPWYITNHGIRNISGHICEIKRPCRYPDQDERYAIELAERQADRHLISAAPDLLEALIKLVDSFVATDEEGLIEHAEQMQLARAAIAKATGSTE